MAERIYWFFPQLKTYTEENNLNAKLCNRLCRFYDIVIVSLQYMKPSKINKRYELDFTRMKFLTAHGKSAFINGENELYTYKNGNDKKKAKQFLKEYKEYKKTERANIRRFIFQMTKYSDYIVCSGIKTLSAMPLGRSFVTFYLVNKETYRSKIYRKIKRESKQSYVDIVTSKSLCEFLRSKALPRRKHPRLYEYIYPYCPLLPKENYAIRGNSLLYIAPFDEPHQPLRVLKVAKQLRENNIKFVLKIFGDGPLLERMDDYITVNNLQEYVKISIDPYELADQLDYSDLLLVTNHTDVFDTNFMQSMVRSLPIISFDYDAKVSEFIENGVSGYKVHSEEEMAERIKELFSDPVVLSKMKRSTYEHSQEINKIENPFEKWKEVLTKVFSDLDYKRQKEIEVNFYNESHQTIY